MQKEIGLHISRIEEAWNEHENQELKEVIRECNRLGGFLGEVVRFKATKVLGSQYYQQCEFHDNEGGVYWDV